MDGAFWKLFSKEPEDTKLAGMDYPQLLSEFKSAAKELRIKDFNPGLGWHSGASINRASKKRGITAIQKRGRWASFSSVRRYEKEGRLNDSWASLTPQQQGYCTAGELQIKEALLHGKVPAQPVNLTRGGPTNGRN